MESFSAASCSKCDNDRTWSFQEWKTDIETYERSGRHVEISWRMIQKNRPGFSHEEILLDGTAQSVRHEETPRDRSGRPDIDSQEKAWPQQFVVGNDGSRIGIVSRIKIIRVSGE